MLFNKFLCFKCLLIQRSDSLANLWIISWTPTSHRDVYCIYYAQFPNMNLYTASWKGPMCCPCMLWLVASVPDCVLPDQRIKRKSIYWWVFNQYRSFSLFRYIICTIYNHSSFLTPKGNSQISNSLLQVWSWLGPNMYGDGWDSV